MADETDPTGASAAPVSPSYGRMNQWPVPSSAVLKSEAKVVRSEEKLRKFEDKRQRAENKAAVAHSKAQRKLEKLAAKRARLQVIAQSRAVRDEIDLARIAKKKAEDDEKVKLQAQGARRSWLTGHIVPVKQSWRARRHLRRVARKNAEAANRVPWGAR